jgi:hypothetical protein
MKDKDRSSRDTGSAAENLVAEAQAARVAAHVRVILSRLKSHAPKPSREGS